MIKLKTVVLVLCISLFFSVHTFGQQIKKYDFIEIIVVQKANNSGKVKRIKVDDQESLKGKNIKLKEIEALKQTSALLNYMNAQNWEFVDRKAVTEPNDPVWMSYLFKKERLSN